MEIKCDLYGQWIDALRQELRKAGLNDSGLKDQDCAIRWQAWKRRTVPASVRTVHRAAGFACPSHLAKGLSDLEDAFRAGAEIWPWQSKLTENPSHEDGLYNDYGVHHFHLGVGTNASGYINRTKELLFALVDSGSVHEIGVYDHGEWYERDILDIIEREWPRLLDPYTLKGIDVANRPQTREEVRELRKANVNAVYKLKSGRIVAPPGGGMAASGTSVQAVRQADWWARVLRNAADIISDDIATRVSAGEWPDQVYNVLLRTSDNKIVAIVEGLAEWTIWKGPS